MSTWKESLKTKASFRNVEFHIDSSSSSIGGRNTVTHEFPGSEEYFIEDMGIKPKSYSISAFVVGDDYFTKRDQLLDAVNMPDAGILIHPYYGKKSVICTSCEVSESRDEGGLARFELTFLPSKVVNLPAAKIDLKSQMQEQSEIAYTTVRENFAKSFQVKGYIKDVQNDAQNTISTFSKELLKKFPIDGLTAEYITDQITTVIENPSQLGSTIVDMVVTIGTKYAASSDFVALAFGDYADLVIATLPRIPSLITRTRIQQKLNRDAFKTLVKQAALITASKLITKTKFETRDEIIDYRDKISEGIRNTKIKRYDVGESVILDQLTDLNKSTFEYLNSIAPTLSKRRQVTPKFDEPIINTVFRGLSSIDQIDNIIGRNKLNQILWLPQDKRETSIDIW